METAEKTPNLTKAPDVQAFRDAFTTRCNGCPSMLAIALPFVHCPACHNRWKARKLASPVRCTACGFNLFNWRKINGVPDKSNATALLA